MSRSVPSMLREFGGNIEALAGKEIRAKVMEGGEKITTKSDGAAVARWMKGAVDRLDGLVDEKTRHGIMERCGTSCAHSSEMIEQAKARRRKHASIDDFLAAEVKKPILGTRLERKGNVLLQTYTPRAFLRPMRCFCALFRDLPDRETASSTYCQCSKAFARTFWREVLGIPVQVTILGTALTGAKECRFKIEF